MNKPITVATREYMDNIVEVTNTSPLPAFVKANVLEQALAELKKLAESELQRDLAAYRQAQEKDKANGGVTHDQRDV